MLFSYDFPHQKTQDFILRLLVEGYTIKYIIVAPWKKLATEQPVITIALSHTELIYPQKICQHFEISKPYIGREEIDAVIGVLRNGFLAQSPKTQELEEKFGDYCDTKYAVAMIKR